MDLSAWRPVEVRLHMVGLPPADLAAPNTLLRRRGLRLLATAGEVIGLRERRWTPLRCSCGRLSGPGKRRTLAEMLLPYGKRRLSSFKGTTA
jgi:hypothetical protein